MKTTSWSAMLLLLVLPLQPIGCAAVTGTIRPNHFQFYDVVDKTQPGADGWRAACVHAYIKNGKLGTSFKCVVSVEVPVETHAGPISIEAAQKNAARCANDAAYDVLMSATDSLPLGIACEKFRDSFRAKLSRALPGSRVVKNCRAESVPVVFGEP